MAWDLINEWWNLGPFSGGDLWPYPRRSWREARPLPALNIYGNDEKLVVTSEISGLTTEDLEIGVQGRTLTLKGFRKAPELGTEGCYTCQERTFGDFERTLTLPYEVDSEKIDARYDGGVLMIRLPRTERDKPRKIAVKTV